MNKSEQLKKEQLLQALTKSLGIVSTACASVGISRTTYYNINEDDNETRLKAIYRLSYLAKVRGKGYRDSQAKDYQTSRLK